MEISHLYCRYPLVLVSRMQIYALILARKIIYKHYIWGSYPALQMCTTTFRARRSRDPPEHTHLPADQRRRFTGWKYNLCINSRLLGVCCLRLIVTIGRHLRTVLQTLGSQQWAIHQCHHRSFDRSIETIFHSLQDPNSRWSSLLACSAGFWYRATVISRITRTHGGQCTLAYLGPVIPCDATDLATYCPRFGLASS
jgi:hypothetical protein